MNLKYFLRGLGSGAVITALILSIAHSSDGNALSDEEIIRRAEQLGMVQQEELLSENTKNPSVTKAADVTAAGEEPEETASDLENSENQDTQESGKTTGGPDKNFSDDILAMATEAAKPSKETEPTKAENTNAPSPTKEPTDTPQPTETPAPESAEKKVITIVSGMWSDQVARELQNMGVVEDAKDFDQFLVKNGYANHIVVGTFEIPANASYEDIAHIITNR